MADRRIGKRYHNGRKEQSKYPHLSILFEAFYNAKIAEGVSPRTLETYQKCYEYLCEYLTLINKIHYLNSVTTEVLRGYITWMLKSKRKWEGHAHKAERDKTVGLSPVTVNTRLKGLRTMFNFLFVEEIIASNPFDKIKPVREPVNKIVIMNSDQMRRILKESNKRTYAGFRDYVFMTLLIDGFFRISTALSIKRSDINFGTGIVRISAERLKSRRSIAVPVERSTLRLIMELIKENMEAGFDSELIFLTNFGEPISRNRMRDRIKQHATAAKVEINVYPHLFRHSAATLFIENGGDPRYLAEILGHSDLRQIMRYTHLSEDSIKEQHAKFSPIKNVIGGKSSSRRIKRLREAEF
ncbi:tyrosine-type recombinase/integrase [Paenibacillus sp. SI8]|uniref:tyrosine-type recombinase/integrase n=1 Tax=unclassified Paenibacillus TaxID=185978 RepID=UPI0034678C9E